MELIAKSAVALRRRDWDAWGATLSPEVIYRPMATFTESEECRGVEEYRRFLDRFFESFADDFAAEITSIRDYGDAVSVRIDFSGHARASGIEISDVVFQVFWCRDGRIVRIEDFATSARSPQCRRASGVGP